MLITHQLAAAAQQRSHYAAASSSRRQKAWGSVPGRRKSAGLGSRCARHGRRGRALAGPPPASHAHIAEQWLPAGAVRGAPQQEAARRGGGGAGSQGHRNCSWPRGPSQATGRADRSPIGVALATREAGDPPGRTCTNARRAPTMPCLVNNSAGFTAAALCFKLGVEPAVVFCLSDAAACQSPWHG